VTSTTTYFPARVASMRAPRRAILGPGWPLTGLYVLFPLWWVLGLSHFIFFIAAIAMTFELVKRRPIYVPMAFGLWLLFLVVVAAGLPLLWVQPDGTVPGSGTGRLQPYVYHLAWYLAITVVAIYVLNMSERDLPSLRVMRLLALMFIFTVGGGYAGLLLPHVDFPSAAELVIRAILNHSLSENSFIGVLIHPALVSASEFLGYDQPRPAAPFAFPNAWGNNLGMFTPFFVATWLGKDAGWRRPVGLVILVLAAVPIAYSLNRGLWIGLFVALVAISVKLATMGRTRALQAIAALVAVGAVVFVSTPLYSTVLLRVQTPDSNARRSTLANVVVSKTADLSPLLGYGETRAVSGSFESIAGGETPNCHQCAAPPLGTQGFMWRLIFTTGLLGTVLFLGFLFAQLARFASMRDPVALACCTAILMSLVFNFVYDSLESPLFTVMVAVGLLNRRFVRESEVASSSQSTAGTMA
jgi:O-antigen ligase